VTLFATLVSVIVSWSGARLSRSMSAAGDKVAADRSGWASLFGGARAHFRPRQPFGRRRKIVPLHLPVTPDGVRFDFDRRGTRCANAKPPRWPDPLEATNTRTVDRPNVQQCSGLRSSPAGTQPRRAVDEQGKFSIGNSRDSSNRLSSRENGFSAVSGVSIGLCFSGVVYRPSFGANASAVGNSNVANILTSPPTHTYPGWDGAGRER
jgi:hypothetical protein